MVCCIYETHLSDMYIVSEYNHDYVCFIVLVLEL